MQNFSISRGEESYSYYEYGYDEYKVIVSIYAYASHEINNLSASLYSILAKFGNHNRNEYLLHRQHDTELLRHHFFSYFPFETSVKSKPF